MLNNSPWHTLSETETYNFLQSNPAGLERKEAANRLNQYGANVLSADEVQSGWRILMRQFTDFMILILLGAAIVAGFIGDITDTFVILAIIAINAAIGFYQEYKAEQTMAALKKIAAAYATVVCNGKPLSLPATGLVPGDVVLLEAGNIVPADIRLTKTALLKIEEASLTGESMPVEKMHQPLPQPDVPLTDQVNMAFKGTVVKSGTATGIVVATGMNTQLGKIANMLQTQSPQTPLQKKLKRFSQKLALAFLGICLLVFLLGILRGENPALMLLTALSLAVAAIPEAMPAMVTVALSLGAKKMADNKALVRRLPAVETLGSVTYICTDKTGTLTLNKMTVGGFIAQASPFTTLQNLPSHLHQSYMQWMLITAALNNDITLNSDKQPQGDPTEVALFDFARKNGYHKEQLLQKYPEIQHFPFEAERKCMSTLHQMPDEKGYVLLVKGAMEALIALAANSLTPEQRLQWEQANYQLAANGFRVLGFGMKQLPQLPNRFTPSVIEQNLTLLGALSLIDPIRPEAADAIALCHQAGIKTVMITGDHPNTAHFIASQLGIIKTDNDLILTGQELQQLNPAELAAKTGSVRVYARVSPEQKLDIVNALQKQGQVVAMTGDGVNDAPALKKADIGVAMAITGTDVAKETAHIILLNDNFATIVKAVKEGRKIYDNIRKFVGYIMSGNTAEIFIILVAPMFGLPIPLLPIHILWVNLVTDGLPGLALAAEPTEENLMHHPPKPLQEGIFANGLGLKIVLNGLFIGSLTLALEFFMVFTSHTHWQTMVFTALCFCQLALALCMRFHTKPLFGRAFFGNPFLLYTLLFTALVQLGLIYLPLLNHLFNTTPLTATELALTTAPAVVVLAVLESGKFFKRRFLAQKQKG